MTTNNKWEEEIRNKDLNGWNNWLIKLIQLEKEESYQRGKEEVVDEDMTPVYLAGIYKGREQITKIFKNLLEERIKGFKELIERDPLDRDKLFKNQDLSYLKYNLEQQLSQFLLKVKEKINNNFEAVADNSERGFNDGLNQGRQETLEKVKEVIEESYIDFTGDLEKQIVLPIFKEYKRKLLLELNKLNKK